MSVNRSNMLQLLNAPAVHADNKMSKISSKHGSLATRRRMQQRWHHANVQRMTLQLITMIAAHVRGIDRGCCGEATTPRYRGSGLHELCRGYGTLSRNCSASTAATADRAYAAAWAA